MIVFEGQSSRGKTWIYRPENEHRRVFRPYSLKDDRGCIDSSPLLLRPKTRDMTDWLRVLDIVIGRPQLVVAVTVMLIDSPPLFCETRMACAMADYYVCTYLVYLIQQPCHFYCFTLLSLLSIVTYPLPKLLPYPLSVLLLQFVL